MPKRCQVSKHETVSDTSARRRSKLSSGGVRAVVLAIRSLLLRLDGAGLLSARPRSGLHSLEAVAEGIDLLAEGAGDPPRVLALTSLSHGREVEARLEEPEVGEDAIHHHP